MSKSKDVLEGEIAHLEQQLRETKAQLKAHDEDARPDLPPNSDQPGVQRHLHNLLLLADSALPLGSFAFSSGLESFLAHTKQSSTSNVSKFSHFLNISLESMSETTVPYVMEAYRSPERLEDLDNDLDASITCAVARRASVAQGRALVTVWERSFRSQARASAVDGSAAHACGILESFCKRLKVATLPKTTAIPLHESLFAPNGHLPPLFGIIGAILALPLDQILYLYLLNHAKTLLSAGIRASVVGPYHAQSLLASDWLTGQIWTLVEREMKTRRRPEDAGQSVPMIDLWGGRHEIVYSRIFNS